MKKQKWFICYNKSSALRYHKLILVANRKNSASGHSIIVRSDDTSHIYAGKGFIEDFSDLPSSSSSLGVNERALLAFV